jgi:hypothetical protein
MRAGTGGTGGANHIPLRYSAIPALVSRAASAPFDDECSFALPGVWVYNFEHKESIC